MLEADLKTTIKTLYQKGYKKTIRKVFRKAENNPDASTEEDEVKNRYDLPCWMSTGNTW